MLRQFFRDSATYGAATLITRAAGLLVVPVYTRILTPADYGAIDLLLVFGSLVNLTIALEISQAVARFYPDTRDASARVEYASSALWFTVATSTGFGLVAWVFADQLSEALLGAGDLGLAFRVALLSIWFGGLSYLIGNQLRWELRARAYAVISVASTFGGILVSLALVVFAGAGLLGVLVGQLVGNALGVALGIIATRTTFTRAVRFSRLTEMLRFSAPLVLSGLGVFTTLYIDRVLINSLLSRADVGIFGIGYRLAALVSLLIVPVQTAVTPLIYNRYQESSTPLELARLFSYFAAAAMVASLTLALFAPEILTVATGPEYRSAAGVVPYLAPALLLANMYIFAPGLALRRRTGAIAVINIAGAAGIIGLNLIMIPALGIAGAAVADLLGNFAIFGTYVILGQRLYRIPYAYVPLSLALAGTVALWILAASIHFGPLIDLAAKAGAIVATVALLMIVGLVEPAFVRRSLRAARLRVARRGG